MRTRTIPPSPPAVLAARLAWQEAFAAQRTAAAFLFRGTACSLDTPTYQAAFRLWLEARDQERAAWVAYNAAIAARRFPL